MELNNWEKEFKKQLNSREIKPSGMAWEKLDAMLSAAEKPKAKFPWMYVAASFVGLLVVGTVYFNQKENTIAIEKNEVAIQKKNQPKNTEKLSNILAVNSSQVEDKVVAVISKKAVNVFGETELKRESIAVKDSSNQNQAVVSINNQIVESESIQSQTKFLTVDELLARANKTIRENKKSNSNLTIHVNPNNLLLQTDGELEPAFRQSMFSKVVEDLRAIKVVLNKDITHEVE